MGTLYFRAGYHMTIWRDSSNWCITLPLVFFFFKKLILLLSKDTVNFESKDIYNVTKDLYLKKKAVLLNPEKNVSPFPQKKN